MTTRHPAADHLTQAERELPGTADSIRRVNARLGPCAECKRPWSAHIPAGRTDHGYARAYVPRGWENMS
jgi:hypothetical protein